jgi:hypothetical protein
VLTDPAIDRVVIVSPREDFAEVVSYFCDGVSGWAEIMPLFEQGRVALVTDDEAFPGRVAMPTDGDAAVRALYVPPIYFVQFTGESWR